MIRRALERIDGLACGFIGRRFRFFDWLFIKRCRNIAKHAAHSRYSATSSPAWHNDCVVFRHVTQVRTIHGGRFTMRSFFATLFAAAVFVGCGDNRGEGTSATNKGTNDSGASNYPAASPATGSATGTGTGASGTTSTESSTTNASGASTGGRGSGASSNSSGSGGSGSSGTTGSGS